MGGGVNERVPSDHTMICPTCRRSCRRLASVEKWVARPICVHAWSGGVPEVWDGDDVGGEGRRIEDSPNEEFRTPGPLTWAVMEPLFPDIPKPLIVAGALRAHSLQLYQVGAVLEALGVALYHRAPEWLWGYSFGVGMCALALGLACWCAARLIVAWREFRAEWKNPMPKRAKR